MRRSSAFAAFALLFTVFLAGCDSVGGDVLTFREEVDFRFEFTTDGVSAGEEIVVRSVGNVDFDDFLEDEGFTKGDLVVANIRSVTVERLTPAGTNLSNFERVAFSLVAEGLTVPTLAESEDLPEGREVELELLRPGVSEVLWQPEFAGRLIVVPATDEDEQYVLTATMDVSVQAEGL